MEELGVPCPIGNQSVINCHGWVALDVDSTGVMRMKGVGVLSTWVGVQDSKEHAFSTETTLKINALINTRVIYYGLSG